MERMIRITILTALLAVIGCREKTEKEPVTKNPEPLSAVFLRCEYRIDPMGIDVTRPRLSWTLESNQRARKQTAYEVLAASDPQELEKNRGDLWDSGKVQSDGTVAVVYDGKLLDSGMDCFWKVRVWDENDQPSDWSRPARWSMGLLKPEDWAAEWIGQDIDTKPQPEPEIIQKAQWIWSDPNANQVAEPGQRYFRKSFVVPTDWIIKSADCYVTADDFVRVFLNGRLIRSFRNSKTLYQITLADSLKPGSNVIAILASNEGNSPSPAGLLAIVRIESQQGDLLEFTTNQQWRTSSDPGPDWQTADYDDSAWRPASEVGLYGCAPWQETKPKPLILPPARYLRGEFMADLPKIKRARLYATALGIYQLFVNGQRVTDDVLSPGWTDYQKRVYYRTYDVTDRLRDGGNAIGAVLADGWYAGYVGGGLTRNHYGQKPRLLAQLNIEYKDGSTQIIATGPDWKASDGPIRHADLLQGELYDARNEMPGWSRAGYDDSLWQPVSVGSDEVNPQVQAAVSQPVIVFKELQPVSVTQPVPGKYVFDMGQNFAGVVRIKVKGKPGQWIQIRHAERLNPDGTIYTTNLRTAGATDAYICKSSTEEVWRPYFTFHGFQYVELSGLNYNPDLETVTGLALSSDTQATGSFECSDAMVNKLYSNIVWTQRANFIDIPTDCPQRDERLGWTGDAQVYINTACYNNDVQAFFTKWLVDLEDAQRADGEFPRYAPNRNKQSSSGPAWADAGIICPWTIYKMYGDRRILEQHYDAMKKYIAYVVGQSTDDLLPPEKFQCFGDWLSINDDTPRDVIHTAYFAHSTGLLARIAVVLGKTEDAQTYNALFDQIKAAFSKAYVQPDGRIKGDTQADYVLAIAYDLLDADQQQKAAAHLVRRIEECDWHLSTGFIGTKDLMLALSKIGRNDVAYRLLLNDTFPSWGFSIKNGATSIWERWNGWTPEEGFGDPGMNSFSHYSFGAVGQWMFENIGGIQTDGSAFKKIIVKPQPGGDLTRAKTAFRSIRGPIVSNWDIDENRFILEVTIPPNTTAVVYLPAAKAEDVLESGGPAGSAEGVRLIGQEGKFVVYEIQSGSYHFVVNNVSPSI